MCRRGSQLCAWIGAAALALASGGARGADESVASRQAYLALDEYLQRVELTNVRAMHLERMVFEIGDDASSAEFEEYARRLAGVYASLMEGARSEETRSDYERRCARLLEVAPAADTTDLRLALAKGRYARAERVAERYRIGTATASEALAAREEFLGVLSVFDRLADEAEGRIRDLDRQQEAGAPRDELMLSAMTHSRRTRSVSRYLGGWSAYYATELGPADVREISKAAEEASVRFGAALDARRGSEPTLDRVGVSNLRYDHIARAALGVAMCWSIRGNASEALRWIDAVEQAPELDPSVREQLAARRAIVLARAEDWGRLASFTDRLAGDGKRPAALSAGDARLFAWLALADAQQQGASPDAKLLICRTALGVLIAHWENGSTLDLVDKYLAIASRDDRASNGFLARMLRAARDYDAARRAHGESGGDLEEPTTDSTAKRRYESAASLVESAMSAADTGFFSEAIAASKLMGGLASYFSAADASGLIRASDQLSVAAEQLRARSDPRGATALRVAIRAAELASAEDASVEARKAELVNLFVTQHPDDPAAAVYSYQRAMANTSGGEAAISALLAVQGNNELRTAARQEAARLLYERFAAAPPDQRNAAGRAYLALALELLEELRRGVVIERTSGAARALLNARGIMSCALGMNPPEQVAAIAAFDLFSLALSQQKDVDPKMEAELHFRATQIAVLRRDWAEAEREVAALAIETSGLGASARRELLRGLLDAWREGQSLELAQRIVFAGRATLTDMAKAGGNSAKDATASVIISSGVAQAAAMIWNETGDDRMRELAAVLFRTALRAEGRSRTVLNDAANFFESSGDREAALEHWRTLLAGLKQGEEEWYRVKCKMLALLVELDPSRARAILEQHRALYPEMGPEPWGTTLREFERAVAAAPATEGGQP